jgi:hypothetical protein
MECPTCKKIHHAKLFGIVKCQECYGRLAQQSSLGKGKGVRKNSARANLSSMQPGANRGGLDN